MSILGLLSTDLLHVTVQTEPVGNADFAEKTLMALIFFLEYHRIISEDQPDQRYQRSKERRAE